MSLYNLLHGVDSTARIALAMLGKGPGDFGRFRDAWLCEGGKSIAVFTRCGGGNRDDYGEVFDMAASMPGYLGNADDDFDSTYCTFTFEVPVQYQDLAARLAPESAPPSLWDKTQAAISAIKAAPPKDVPQDKATAIVAAIEAAVQADPRIGADR